MGKQRSEQAQDSVKSDAEPISAAQSQGAAEKTGATSDIFYKQKDTDRNVLSANDDDLWDELDSVVETKAAKKPNMKVSESDFENEAAVQQPERRLTR